MELPRGVVAVKYLVQKFGGTSLVGEESRRRVADIILAARDRGYHPVVVSAIGRKGDPYATDTLLSMVREIWPEIQGRELDLLLSCGEIISGVIMTATLRARGAKAVFLTGGQAGIITDSNFNQASILEVRPQRIHNLSREGNIVVVAGFQGVTEDGEITTLGRGGSDTTAAALGVALEAEAVEIYTDVNGIMTADPRYVAEARPLDVVTYTEICNMAHMGAKVIHPRAVEIAMAKNIPLWVKCTFSDEPGTLVTTPQEVRSRVGIRDRVITGIAHMDGITQLRIPLQTNGDAPMRIFQAMADAGISVDFINVNPDKVIFTVNDEVQEKAVAILKEMGFKPEVIPDCAKVSCIGAGMAGVPGVMARIVSALSREGINILQSSDSHTTIWCLVKREDMERALMALHREFELHH